MSQRMTEQRRIEIDTYWQASKICPDALLINWPQAVEECLEEIRELTRERDEARRSRE